MNKGIAFAGTIAVDEVKIIERYPPKSQLTSILSKSWSGGGAVSNCAITLAKMDPDLHIETIALIGDDEMGHFLSANLEKYPNIDTKQIRVVGDTPFTDVMTDMTDGTRTFFAYRGNSTLFDDSYIDLQDINAEILHIAYILLLDALDQECPEYGTKMARLLKHAQDAGLKTSIDIVTENGNRYAKIVPPSLKYTNFCIVNEVEASKTTGIELRDASGRLIASNVRPVLTRLKEFGVQDWVVIHAPEGSFGYDGQNYYSVPSLQLDPQDIKGTVGAGDAYVAGVLYGASKGLNITEAMEIGTAAAASSLLAPDSTSGVKPYEELINMHKQLPKQTEVTI